MSDSPVTDWTMEMHYVDNERLIALVKDRPVLWDKSIEHYKCRNSTALAWKEVCSKLHEKYTSWDHNDKETFGRNVLKKWTNLKDCWWRSCKKRGTKSRVKPYRYYREMIFLKKNQEQSNGRASTNTDMQESDSNGSDTLWSDEVELPVQTIKSDKQELTTLNQLKQEPKPNQQKQELNQQKQELNQATASDNRITGPPPTENRHISFVRGILPALELLNEDQVLQYQMEVLSVLHRIKRLPGSESPTIFS